MESIVNFYPVFEPDQVLTSENLNSIVNYLEQQERLTRNKLIGIGIVCGLELSNVKSPFSINISNGCGVTSGGYLIIQENVVLKKYTDYQDPAGYEHFSDNKGKQNISLWELLEDSETREGKKIIDLADSTTDFKLDDMAVILYMEALTVDLKTCTENECDEKGKRRNFIVRRLLISKADLVKIINKCKKKFSPQSLTELKLKEAILAKYKLKELNIKRLSTASNKIIEYEDLINFYKNAVDGFTGKVSDALENAYMVYKDVISIHYKNVNPLLNLKSHLNAYKDDSIKNHYTLQYYYDFLKDLVIAYNDFRREAFDLMAECCPDDSCFPFHLMINEAIIKNSKLPTIFRHYFIPSPILNGQSEKLYKVLTLFVRIVDMCNNYFIPETGKAKIKITPSNEDLTSLEHRAIPYYYFNSPYTINKNWNYDLKRKFRDEYNYSYHSDKYVNEQAPDEVVKALEYNIDEYPFLRIEGHIGKNYISVMNEINSLRSKFNLPFEVVGLKLSKDFSDTSASIKCLYRDLESMYNYLRSELICILTKEMRFFSGINYRKDIFKTSEDPNKLHIHTNINLPGLTGNVSYKNFMMSSTGGNIENETLGEIYNIYYNEPVKENISNFAYNYLKDKGLLGVLKQMNDIIVYFNYPLGLINDIEGLVKELPEDANDFNLTSFTGKYSAMIKSVNAYRKEIIGSTVKNKEEILDHIDKLFYDCSLAKFKTLFDDLKKRIEEIKKTNLFYYFLQKHPGLEHKAGVEKGGTFVIVYADTDDIEESPGGLRQLFMLDNDELIKKINSFGLLKEEAAVLSEKIIKTTENTREENSNVVFGSIVKNVNELEAKNMEDQEVKIAANNIIKFIKDRVNENNMVVVADFCLPYICCSDCPPITYVIGTTTEKVSVSIIPNEFCSDDIAGYDFIVSPPGGTVSGPGVKNNKFSPSGVVLSNNEDIKEVQFVYTTTDARTATTSAKIYKKPAAKFEFKAEDISGISVIIRFTNLSSQNSKNFLWDFGDSTTSAEKNPQHKYELKKPGENLFVVSLTVTNGVCTSTFKQELKLSPEIKTAVITIKNTEFCVIDRIETEITVTPDDNTGKLSIGGKQIIKKAPGTYIFVPASVKSTLGNNQFIVIKLEYTSGSGTTASKEIKVFNMPIPNFKIKNIQKGSGTVKAKVVFSNTSKFAEKNEWHVKRLMQSGVQDLGAIGTTLKNDDATIQFDVSPGIMAYEVILKVINGACSKDSDPLSIKISEIKLG